MSDFAVVMDMDGLMVDSEPLSRQAWDQVLGRYGQLLDDDFYSGLIGHRTADSAKMLVENYDLPLTAAALAIEKSEVLAGIRASGVPVMPGLYEVQSRIKQRGLPWGVATSSPRTHAEEILEQLGLSASCQALAGGDEVEQGKPAPDIYLLAAGRLGIPPHKCIAIEDSAPGCRAALAAGMMVIAIPNGSTNKADFSAVDFIYSSLHEVADKFDQLLAELERR